MPSTAGRRWADATHSTDRAPRILTELRGVPGGRWDEATSWVGLGWRPRGRLRRLADILEAIRMWSAARRGDVILGYCGTGSALWLGLMMSVFGSRGAHLVLWAPHWYEPGPLRRRLIQRVCAAADAIVVWSRQVVRNYSAAFGVPEDKFVVIPYKANFSKHDDPILPWGGYVFSGGNSERDYATLFRAVEGTGIPVIVSRTKPALTDSLQCPSNVVIVSATGEHYRRLMAGSDIVVMALRKGLLRGAGEQTVLNAMWYGKPVVAADDVSSSDYVLEGKTGFVVPAGDVTGLRAAILQLWGDPGLRRRMGEEARRLAEEQYTHDRWVERLLGLATARLGSA